MRYFFQAFGFLGLIFLLSCSSKQKMTNNTASVPDLSGVWELREQQNGMMPNQQVPAGSGTFYRFTKSGFEWYENNRLVNSGSYTIVNDTTVDKEVGLVMPANEFRQRFVFNNNPDSAKVFFQLSGNNLSTVAGYFPIDGGSRRLFSKTSN